MNILLALSLILFLPLLAQANITVSWRWLSTSHIQEDGFELERSPEGCLSWELIAINPPGVMSIRDIDVPGNCYRVRAFANLEYYPYSNIGIVPQPVDTTPPVVSITSPTNNASVARRSIVTIRSTFSDNIGVTSVRYLVNGSQLSCFAMATSCDWSVPNPPNKNYTIRVEAQDQAGRVGAAQVAVRSGR
jgi:hypothetical protein